MIVYSKKKRVLISGGPGDGTEEKPHYFYDVANSSGELDTQKVYYTWEVDRAYINTRLQQGVEYTISISAYFYPIFTVYNSSGDRVAGFDWNSFDWDEFDWDSDEYVATFTPEETDDYIIMLDTLEGVWDEVCYLDSFTVSPPPVFAQHPEEVYQYPTGHGSDSRSKVPSRFNSTKASSAYAGLSSEGFIPLSDKAPYPVAEDQSQAVIPGLSKPTIDGSAVGGAFASVDGVDCFTQIHTEYGRNTAVALSRASNYGDMSICFSAKATNFKMELMEDRAYWGLESLWFPLSVAAYFRSAEEDRFSDNIFSDNGWGWGIRSESDGYLLQMAEELEGESTGYFDYPEEGNLPGIWHRYALVRSGYNIRLYVDGRLVRDNVTMQVSGYIENYLLLEPGRNNSSFTAITVYDRALSSGEISHDYVVEREKFYADGADLVSSNKIKRITGDVGEVIAGVRSEILSTNFPLLGSFAIYLDSESVDSSALSDEDELVLLSYEQTIKGLSSSDKIDYFMQLVMDQNSIARLRFSYIGKLKYDEDAGVATSDTHSLDIYLGELPLDRWTTIAWSPANSFSNFIIEGKDLLMGYVNGYPVWEPGKMGPYGWNGDPIVAEGLSKLWTDVSFAVRKLGTGSLATAPGVYLADVYSAIDPDTLLNSTPLHPSLFHGGVIRYIYDELRTRPREWFKEASIPESVTPTPTPTDDRTGDISLILTEEFTPLTIENASEEIVHISAELADTIYYRSDVSSDLWHKLNDPQNVSPGESIQLYSYDGVRGYGESIGTISIKSSESAGSVKIYGKLAALSGFSKSPINSFKRLFADIDIEVDASELDLDMTTAVSGVFEQLFADSKLAKAPTTIPAAALKATKGCANAFSGCTDLVEPSEFELVDGVLVLGSEACTYMYNGCSSLIRMPKCLTDGTTIVFTGSSAIDEMFAETALTGSVFNVKIKTESPKTAIRSPFTDSGLVGASIRFVECDSQSLVAMNSLFEGLTEFRSLDISADTISSDSVYIDASDMCGWCTALTEVSSTTLSNVYKADRMFRSCTDLKKIPRTRLKGLADSSFKAMCSGCVKLTSFEVDLPGEYADGAFMEICDGCIALTEPPSFIQVTTLKPRLFKQAFRNCRALTKAPRLLLQAVENGEDALEALYETFHWAVKLSELRVSWWQFIDHPEVTTGWLSGVSSSGVLYATYPGRFSDVIRGADTVPDGWLVVEE